MKYTEISQKIEQDSCFIVKRRIEYYSKPCYNDFVLFRFILYEYDTIKIERG